MKTEVYSWRVSSDVKTSLEREARRRKISMSAALDLAAREWLQKSGLTSEGDEEQRRLQKAASKWLGTTGLKAVNGSGYFRGSGHSNAWSHKSIGLILRLALPRFGRPTTLSYLESMAEREGFESSTQPKLSGFNNLQFAQL